MSRQKSTTKSVWKQRSASLKHDAEGGLSTLAKNMRKKHNIPDKNMNKISTQTNYCCLSRVPASRALSVWPVINALACERMDDLRLHPIALEANAKLLTRVVRTSELFIVPARVRGRRQNYGSSKLLMEQGPVLRKRADGQGNGRVLLRNEKRGNMVAWLSDCAFR